MATVHAILEKLKQFEEAAMDYSGEIDCGYDPKALTNAKNKLDRLRRELTKDIKIIGKSK